MDIKITIVIPVYNDRESLCLLLDNLSCIQGIYEIIISDASDSDCSISYHNLLKRYDGMNIKYIKAKKGRGYQLNSGAKISNGDVILFLHSDSIIELDSISKVKQSILNGVVFGCFKLKFDNTTLLMRICALMSNMRVKYRKIGFGDQGLFFRKDVFEKLSGFKNIAIMEDYDISIRAKKSGYKITQINSQIITSSRRFYKNRSFIYALKVMLIMQVLQYKFRRGEDLDIIKKIYQKI